MMKEIKFDCGEDDDDDSHLTLFKFFDKDGNGFISCDRWADTGGTIQGGSHPYAIMTQRKARNAPSRVP